MRRAVSMRPRPYNPLTQNGFTLTELLVATAGLYPITFAIGLVMRSYLVGDANRFESYFVAIIIGTGLSVCSVVSLWCTFLHGGKRIMRGQENRPTWLNRTLIGGL